MHFFVIFLEISSSFKHIFLTRISNSFDISKNEYESQPLQSRLSKMTLKATATSTFISTTPHPTIKAIPIIEKEKYIESIFHLFEKTANPSIISDCIWSLGYFGLRINEHNCEIIFNKLHIVLNSYSVSSKKFNEIDIAKLFLGLSKLKYSYSNVTHNSTMELLTLFESNIDSFSARSFSNILWSLSKIGNY